MLKILNYVILSNILYYFVLTFQLFTANAVLKLRWILSGIGQFIYTSILLFLCYFLNYIFQYLGIQLWQLWMLLKCKSAPVTSCWLHGNITTAWSIVHLENVSNRPTLWISQKPRGQKSCKNEENFRDAMG